jgi:phosphohistidine phosphatase SixA
MKPVVWAGLAGLVFSVQSLGAEELPQADLIKALQGGGHVIYLRHAATERDYADQISAAPDNCATQRVLSEKGWHQARSIGQAINALNIPVSEVISSEYCRAWQTADLAFGGYRKSAELNFEPAETYTDAQFDAMRGRVVPLISAPSAAGNRVIVGHDDPFEAATGIYPEPQGVAYVLRPDGAGGFEVLGHIDPDAWPAG